MVKMQKRPFKSHGHTLTSFRSLWYLTDCLQPVAFQIVQCVQRKSESSEKERMNKTSVCFFVGMCACTSGLGQCVLICANGPQDIFLICQASTPHKSHSEVGYRCQFTPTHPKYITAMNVVLLLHSSVLGDFIPLQPTRGDQHGDFRIMCGCFRASHSTGNTFLRRLYTLYL